MDGALLMIRGYAKVVIRSISNPEFEALIRTNLQARAIALSRPLSQLSARTSCLPDGVHDAQ
jgi:hypothetical protein